MKGTILGFNADTGTGTISGDDGNRYGFSRAEWRGEKPLAAGIAVDFEARGSEAVGVYPVVGAPAAAAQLPDLGALAASPAVAKARGLLTGTLTVPLALVVLIACLLTAISSPSFGGRNLSLFGVGPLVSEYSERARGGAEMAESQVKSLDEEQAQLEKVIAATGPATPVGYFGSGPTAGDQLKDLAEQREKAGTEASSARWIGWIASASILRFAAPLCALALLVMAWMGMGLKLPALATGAASILAFVLLYALTAMSQGYLVLGFGAWLLLIAGIAILPAGLGMVRNPLAAKA